MMRLPILLFVTLVLAAGPLRAAEPDDVLPLDQAVALALQNNRRVKKAGLEVEKAQNQVAATRTYRLPSIKSYALSARQLSHVDLRFEKGALGVLDGVGPVPSEDTTIKSSGRFSLLLVNELSQPISQLHKIGLGVK